MKGYAVIFVNAIETSRRCDLMKQALFRSMSQSSRTDRVVDTSHRQLNDPIRVVQPRVDQLNQPSYAVEVRFLSQLVQRRPVLFLRINLRKQPSAHLWEFHFEAVTHVT